MRAATVFTAWRRNCMRINDHFKYLNIGLPEDILRRKMYGDFEGAIRLIDQKLGQDVPEALKSCLIVQREINSGF